MRKTVYILLLVSLSWACDNENSWDCLKKIGEEVETEIFPGPFQKLWLSNGFILEVTEGPTQKVTITTGKNLLNAINYYIIDDRLFFEDNNSCNMMRPHNPTIIRVTSPNINQIDNYGSGSIIRSTGTLTFGDLRINSKSHSSIFDLDIDNNRLMVICNDITTFKLRGKTRELNIQIAASDSRLEAQNLIAENIIFIHRGTNDILVHPVASLVGQVMSTGNLIYVNKPVFMDIDVSGRGTVSAK
ncbi:MAG: DUF2807 domain-containing protein [Cyclobacteriaceae bacterium]|nr:DUF2807 domain-containing protein [Cyclobacteriaceae bacterium]